MPEGRVHLAAVVRLDDLDVPLRRQRFGRLTDQGCEQRDAEGEVAGAQDRNAIGGLRHHGKVDLFEARGADHEGRPATLGAQGGQFGRGGACGEVDDHVGGGDRVCAGDEALAHVPIETGGERGARVFGHKGGDHLPHAPVGAGDGDADRGDAHGRSITRRERPSMPREGKPGIQANPKASRRRSN